MNILQQILNGTNMPTRLGACYRSFRKGRLLILLLGCFACQEAVFAERQTDVLKPYDGPSNPGVDPTALTGKVMTGYQGWFNCDGDGADLGWTHWAKTSRKPVGPGNVTVDLWPDVSEYDDDEGTAIFKCSNNPPISGGAEFLTLDGLPSDFYLRLAGQAGRLLREEIPLSTAVPEFQFGDAH